MSDRDGTEERHGIARYEPWFAAAFAVLVGGLAILAGQPPAAVPASAPDTVFSAERAMEHVRRIAAAPHPTGSEESVKVHAYIKGRLEAIGLNVTVQRSEAKGLENLIAVLPGSKPLGPGVMLAAHSDSVPSGPGAGDDAAGVAAILEAVRAVRAGPPLANDLVVLITDGEELGLLGAKVFADDGAWLARIGLVLNFEARGNHGGSTMFETSDRNGWLVREFARAAPYPAATSLAYAVYKRMPNNTDLTILKQHGLKGLNFAFVEGVDHYHQPTDTPENLDPRSLQHHGSYALALARHFGNLDLTRADSEPDAVYFSVMGPHLIVYPVAWARPLAGLAALGFVVVAGLGLWKGGATPSGLVLGASVGLFAIAVPTALAWGLWTLILPWRPDGGPKGYFGSVAIAFALAMVAGFTGLGIGRLVGGRLSGPELTLGSQACWLVLAAGTAMALPGGSYLFLWPFVLTIAASGLTLLAPRADRPLAYLGATGPLVLVVPTLQAICVSLGPSQPYAASPLAALLAVALWPLLARPEANRIRP